MMIQSALVGALGADTDTTLTAASAAALKRAGLEFVVRYISLGSESPGDLSVAETKAILSSGLALMAVQHVREPGWLPSQALGAQDGSHAAGNAVAAGIPAGVSVWLDLEGVLSTSTPQGVIAYCNAWNAAVKSAGYSTGVYVGAACGLDGDALYNSLSFTAYWRSQSQVPNVTTRGYCMIQLYPSETVAGVAVDYDVVQQDYLGGLPRWVVST
jgi:hypothetical protein